MEIIWEMLKCFRETLKNGRSKIAHLPVSPVNFTFALETVKKLYIKSLIL